jgi:hypothetical protein
VCYLEGISTVQYTDKTVNLKSGWNETAGEEAKSWEKKLSHCHFVHHKSDIQWTGVKPAENPWLTFWVRERRLDYYHYTRTFSKKRAVNAESYLIVFSQSVYRLRSPDISVHWGNTNKSRSAMTVLQHNSRLCSQQEQKTLGRYNSHAIIWSDQSNTPFILYLMYNSGNMFRLAIESCFVLIY